METDNEEAAAQEDKSKDAKKQYDLLLKILFIGDSGVGAKSSFILRYADNLIHSGITTIGIDFNNKTVERGGRRVKLQLWDTAGQERFRTITSAYYRGVQAIVLGFDLTDYKSFQNVSGRWMEDMQRHASGTPCLLIAHKCDLEDRIVVSDEEITNMCDRLGFIGWFKTSSLQNINIRESMDFLVDNVLYVNNEAAFASDFAEYHLAPTKNLTAMQAAEVLIGSKKEVVRVGDMDKNEVAAFSEALRTNQSCKIVTIGLRTGAPHIADGVAALSNAVCANSTVSALHLHGFPIGDHGATMLAHMLQANKTLKTLSLFNNAIGDDGAKILAAALQLNNSLETIRIGRSKHAISISVYGPNYVAVQGAKAIAKALKVNKSLTSLDLFCNEIGPEGTSSIAEALTTNVVIKKLRLSGNAIGDEGVRSLVGLLVSNDSLTSLHVANNKITAKGAMALCDALKKNVKLTDLNIAGNEIGNNGAQAVAELIKMSKSLRELNVGNSVDAQLLAEAVVEQFQRNGFLTLTKIIADNSTSSFKPNGVLGQVPVDILHTGLNGVVKYFAKLTNAVNLRRVKLLVVGYQHAGKTTLLNLLQPIVYTEGSKSLHLQGNLLRLVSSSLFGQKEVQVQFSKGWTLLSKGSNFILQEPKGISVSFQVSDKSVAEIIRNRINHTLFNVATHGVDVRSFSLTDVQKHDVNIIAWDFAGQEEYYNSHHHFLNDQAVYLVLWDVRRIGSKESDALLFWFRSLRTALPPPKEAALARAVIIVVGTHIDRLNSQDQPRASQAGKQREDYVLNTAANAGLTWPLCIVEMSGTAHFMGLDNVNSVLSSNIGAIAGNGLLISESVVLIEKCLKEFNKETAPFVRLKDVVAQVRYDEIVVSDALQQLDAWGQIVFQPKVSDLVVLSPTFLTQKAIGELFRPGHGLFMNSIPGYLRLRNLSTAWNDPTTVKHQDELIKLLCHYDICYKYRDDFLVIPSLLSKEIPPDFFDQWPQTHPPGTVELCRIFSVDVLPSHLITRILSRLNKSIHQEIVWHDGGMFIEGSTLGTVRSEPDFAGPGGRVTIRVRPFDDGRADGMALLAHIVDVCRDCIALSPGVQASELLECTCGSSTCMPTVVAMVSVLNEGKTLCPRKRPVSPQQLLVRAGVISQPSIETNAPEMKVEQYASLLERFEFLETAFLNVARNVDECNYPALFILTPQDKPSAWVTKIVDQVERLAFKKFQLLPLCEFSLDKEQLIHPPVNAKAQPIKDVKCKVTVARLSMALKVTCIVLSAVQVGVRIVGIPLPDIASALSGLVDVASQASSIVDNVQTVLNKATEHAINTDVQIERTDIEPQRLKGDALGAVHEIFGDNLNGVIETADLYRTTILRVGCPSGALGSCSFLCSAHHDLVRKWNNGQIDEGGFAKAAREIVRTDWSSFS